MGRVFLIARKDALLCLCSLLSGRPFTRALSIFFLVRYVPTTYKLSTMSQHPVAIFDVKAMCLHVDVASC